MGLVTEFLCGGSTILSGDRYQDKHMRVKHTRILLLLVFLTLVTPTAVQAKGMSESCYGEEMVQISNRLRSITAENKHRLIKDAHTGNVEAQEALGAAYIDGGTGGIVVEKSRTKAAYWLRKAAEQGSLLSQWFLIALKYERIDSPGYLEEIAAVAEQGLVYAQAQLGQTYYFIDKNYSQAAKWWQMAAEHGCIYVAYELGVMYEEGKGVARNHVTAYMWYSLVADVIPDAEKKKESLKTTMTADQITEAQRYAAGWRARHSKMPRTSATPITYPQHGTSVTSMNRMLSDAAGAGRNSVIMKLIAKGADVNASNPDQFTPLLRAALGGHSKTVDLLLEEGAEIDAKDMTGTTALAWVARMGNLEMVETLVNHGADIHQSDNISFTPLIHAASRGHAAVLKFLLTRRANPNDRLKNGRSALMLARTSGNAEVVKILETAGAK